MRTRIRRKTHTLHLLLLRQFVTPHQTIMRIYLKVVSEAYTSIIQAKWKPLQTLALSGQIRFMDKLLADGLNIDSGDKDGLTALQLAIVGKEEAAISHLLRKGANPHVKGDGASSLHYAVQIGALQTVKLLIKYNVEDNVI
ncbi:ankyrin repeat domain-containing protein EMB506, chloroplastic-like isoform X2 [Ricinus communis]|uniref:ankyrin repeat domain-containing protein EMB506, chloroplastic-like isoform X2 n=1 Tax=Ricinus communis TaxID=3988 RepID=UPI00201ABF29|nr:ankyrin repeat domain-containing protein EMB506, chloroplastic-like isoform X2 [Ricinus communis]